MAQPSTDLLAGTRLFSDVDTATLGRLASDFIEREFAAGTEIAKEGDTGLNFFVVESGEAIVSVAGEEVARLGPGGSFGEVALVDKAARTATITAVTDMRTYALPVWSFRSFVEVRPDVAWRLLEILAERLRTSQTR
jgi:CRP/FNR family cyclic AMP-dependent transcriptional regulator